jgi:hypothetical protein
MTQIKSEEGVINPSIPVLTAVTQNNNIAAISKVPSSDGNTSGSDEKVNDIDNKIQKKSRFTVKTRSIKEVILLLIIF